MLNPTSCYHAYIPGLGWDRAPASWLEQKWRLEGELMLDESRNQGKSLGTELEGGMMGTRLEWEAWARAGHKAANRRGESGVPGRQQSQAQALVPLWWGSICQSALSRLGDGCCVEPGLCDSWKWHRASRAGDNASLLWANHKGFGKQKWSHAVQGGRMGKRMSLKPSLMFMSLLEGTWEDCSTESSDACPVAAPASPGKALQHCANLFGMVTRMKHPGYMEYRYSSLRSGAE